MKELGFLIQRFISLAFAPHQDGMGSYHPSPMLMAAVDSTLLKRTGKSTPLFPSVYQTLPSADSPLGRGTRIWKVRDSEGEIRVLKDLWLE
ncbi:hypothetical protein BDP27DRAFT_29555 [Rhodocollybia butyracea]|uniref:Uncharacterized protein n=1 Tax=Rhodocollybia butyracea TaxID=206335 RepID=A0A9P5Q626_9AGAR|nr:hypothetical protein BDP27DRAFT_29555 [Rhodocollybia butyracea]